MNNEVIILSFEFDSFEDYSMAFSISGEEYKADLYGEHETKLYERGLEVRACIEQRFPFVCFCVCDEISEIIDTNINFSAPEVFKLVDSNGRLLFRKNKAAIPEIAGIYSLINDRKVKMITSWPKSLWARLPATSKDPNDLLRTREIRQMSATDTMQFLKNRIGAEIFKPFFLKTKDKVGGGLSLAKTFMDRESVDKLFNQERNKEQSKSSPFVYRLNGCSEDGGISYVFEMEPYYCGYRDCMVKSQDRFIFTGGEFIASDVMAIRDDADGNKLEYRCFVINNQINSISRYKDGEVEDVPSDVVAFAAKVAERVATNPGWASTYVVDVAMTNLGVEVVEFNPLENSGRYSGNCPRNMVSALFYHYPESRKVEIVDPEILVVSSKLEV